MLQIPPNIAVKMSKHKGNEAAAYLEAEVNNYANEGWEFQRVDSIGVELNPGYLSSLFGRKKENIEYYVITFRRQK